MSARAMGWVAAIGLVLASAAAQAVPAGQVLFTLGRVEIERSGQTLAAARGTELLVGDTINTGPTAFTQLRFKDGAVMALRAGSRITVEDFKLPDPAPVPAAVQSKVSAVAPTGFFGGGRSILRLARGAFRTITGLIGKGPGDEYKVVTPAATIGIRGTDYSASYCDANCGPNPTGLYVGVSYGGVTVNNDTGQLNLGDNEYGYVKDNGTSPSQEVTPPPALEAPIQPEQQQEGGESGGEPAPSTGGSTDTGTSSGTSSGGTSSDSGPPPDSSTTTDTGASTTPVVESTAPIGTYTLLPGVPGSYAFGTTGFRDSLDNGVYTDSNGAFIGFLANTFTSIGSAQNVNQGFDAATGLTWGRWSGGQTGGANVIDLSNQSLHWIYAYAPDSPVMPVSGAATYDLIGNTDPTDAAGNVGFLGSATFTANFVSQTVSSTLNIGINSQVWQAASTSGSINGSLFSGSYSVGINNAGGSPIGSGSGSFNGFFTNNASGAGLSYNLSGLGATVSGVAAFGNPH